MPRGYTELYPRRPIRNGDHGGDRQASESWSRRFYREVKRGHFAMVEVDFYLVQDDNGPVSLEREISYTLCTDPRKPGETGGEWSDVRYSEVEFDGTPTDTDARNACAAVKPQNLTWNGKPFQ